MKIRVCATGDLMLLERFPPNYDIKPIADVINSCDVKITNLESVVSAWDCHASTFCGGQWINTEPDNLDEIKKFGFNFYGCANNHAMDYSFGGILSTMRELKKRGMRYAGIGESLIDSSSSKIMELPDKHVKIAFLSVTSTFIDAARAGDGHDGIPARPGINPLRIRTKYYVNREQFEILKQIAEDTYINGERNNARKIGSLPPEEKNSLNFGGHFFCVDDNLQSGGGKFTYCHEGDLARIQKEIKRAKQQADYVFVSFHSHQIKRESYSEPDYFAEEFARKSIDAGADAILGGGTHQLKPIEIYKGRPIFYSLGNFVFQSDDKLKNLPADFWDKYGYSKELSIKEGLNIKTKNGTVGLETDKSNYLSVLPVMEFENGFLQKATLNPIALGFEKEPDLKGLPFIADEQDSDAIFEQIERISKEYDTKFVRHREMEIIIDKEKESDY